MLAAVVLLASGCTAGTRGEGRTTPAGPGRLPRRRPHRRAARALPLRHPGGRPARGPRPRGATGGDLEAARIGPATNDTVAVLLPQISGLCGWGRWATAAEDETGLTSLLVNPCGYGESVCTDEEDADPLNEVAAAVAMARGDSAPSGSCCSVRRWAVR